MPVKQIDLPDRGTMEPQVGLFYTMQKDLRQRVVSAAAELTPTQLAWVPEEGGNSIGELLLHIAEVELFWVQYVCNEQEPPEAQRAEYRTELFGKPGAPHLEERPIAWFVEKLEDSRRLTVAWYTTLTDLSLDETRRFSGEDGHVHEFAVRWVLYHLLEHEAGHRAQILMLRRMLKARGVA